MGIEATVARIILESNARRGRAEEMGRRISERLLQAKRIFENAGLEDLGTFWPNLAQVVPRKEDGVWRVWMWNEQGEETDDDFRETEETEGEFIGRTGARLPGIKESERVRAEALLRENGMGDEAAGLAIFFSEGEADEGAAIKAREILRNLAEAGLIEKTPEETLKAWIKVNRGILTIRGLETGRKNESIEERIIGFVRERLEGETELDRETVAAAERIILEAGAGPTERRHKGRI